MIKGIKLEKRIGTWYQIDEQIIKYQKLGLFESERYGDEAAALVVNMAGMKVLGETFDGLHDDILDELN